MKIFPITGKRLAMLALAGAASFLSSVSAQPAPDQPAPAVRNGAVASESQPLVLAPPLRDAYWAVIYGPDAVHCNPPLWPRPAASTHGCTVTDWFKVDFDGHRRKDGIDVPADWLSYGETVLAGADAIVSKVVSDVPEPADVKPDGSTPDAAGNYVSLDMGGNRRVFYEHLKAGSIPVRAGQKVRRGEVIGRVGYSGNAIGPHLRMRVVRIGTGTRETGLPYVIDDFGWFGTFGSFEDFMRERPWSHSSNGLQRTGERPAALSVVGFAPAFYWKHTGAIPQMAPSPGR
jgi:murein DD-endopeptidase MepM/ murein hydrolase activator NlpD